MIRNLKIKIIEDKIRKVKDKIMIIKDKDNEKKKMNSGCNNVGI